VAADIEESAKSAVVAADNDDGFSGDEVVETNCPGDCTCSVRATSCHVFTEYAQTLEFGDAGIGKYPRGGNG